MSERKVLNKYYPPDFDPAKIPRARCPKNRQFTVRLMAPCNMKCYTCGEYIAKGKKFNARKEDVENMTYLGVRIYRFYIKCPGCLAEISFRTDPESTDYIIEAGAHRNFQALKLAEDQAAKEAEEVKETIEANPMLLLENRTQQSQYEMEVLENLEDLRELNERHAGLDLVKMVGKFDDARKLTEEQREEAEHLAALKALGYEMVEGKFVKKVDEDDLDENKRFTKKMKFNNASDILTSNAQKPLKKIDTMKSKMAGLIKVSKKIDSSGMQKKPSPEILQQNSAQENTEKSSLVTKNCEESNDKEKIINNTKESLATPKVSSGLSLLGDYSDSGTDSEGNDS